MSLIEIIKKTVDVLKKQPANGYEEKYARDCSVLLAEIERLTKDGDELKQKHQELEQYMLERGTAYGISDLEIQNTELKLQIESWKNSRDGVLAHIEQIECEKLKLEKENAELKDKIQEQEMWMQKLPVELWRWRRKE